jgi:hypothetical protein
MPRPARSRHLRLVESEPQDGKTYEVTTEDGRRFKVTGYAPSVSANSGPLEPQPAIITGFWAQLIFARFYMRDMIAAAIDLDDDKVRRYYRRVGEIFGFRDGRPEDDNYIMKCLELRTRYPDTPTKMLAQMLSEELGREITPGAFNKAVIRGRARRKKRH